jgi:hypothetical protein
MGTDGEDSYDEEEDEDYIEGLEEEEPEEILDQLNLGAGKKASSPPPGKKQCIEIGEEIEITDSLFMRFIDFCHQAHTIGTGELSQTRHMMAVRTIDRGTMRCTVGSFALSLSE